MADGKVLTGFSKPYVAVYSASGGTISYTGGRILARGVEVNIEPEEASEDNIFYADNQAAETISGVFTGGNLNLVVDGLLTAAEKLIFGLPTAGTDGFTPYDDDMSVPDIGFGCIARYMSGGTTSYVPIVLPKVKFNLSSLKAATQGEQIEWQTQELTAKILRADDSKHTWKKVGAEKTTEALAEAVIKTELDITTAEPDPEED